MRLRQLINENRVTRNLWDRVTKFLLNQNINPNARTLDIPGPHEVEVWEEIVKAVEICHKNPEKMDNCKKYLLPRLNGNETARNWILSPNGRQIILDIASDRRLQK